ncbi:MAG: 3-isopropylmalate dehydrogenase [Planctomycetes bacterium]|nr:3-isopropylmalate dehydrogenase [Planctomycetota bacterium]
MHKIGVLGGDGIGPEVVREGIKVLRAAAGRFGFDFSTVDYPYGADHYLATKEVMPKNALDDFRKLDAIFLGAIGDPRIETGLLERGIVGAIRFGLDLYVNLRPIRLYAEHLCPLKGKTPKDLDILVIRENTEDVYVNIGGFLKKGTPDEVASAEMIYTRKGVERVIRYAFEACRARDKAKKLTLVDKANAIAAHDLWRRTFDEVGREYPDITLDRAYVDATCMWMVKNPESFDTIVTTNMFGDIITDLGAMLQGGLGIAAGGNIHPGKVSMFEPIHGSAPKYRGKNVANPLAAIGAGGMMLEHLGEREAAQAIDDAIARLLTSKEIPSLGTDSGLSTTGIGDRVVAALGGKAAGAARKRGSRKVQASSNR